LPIGKIACLVSGLVLTNTYQEHTANVANFAKTNIMVESVYGGSGIAYYVHGYPMIGFPAYAILASGEILTSGSYTLISSELYNQHDAYDEYKVGVKARQTDESGNVTILVARRRY